MEEEMKKIADELAKANAAKVTKLIYQKQGKGEIGILKTQIRGFSGINVSLDRFVN